jgi:hypothetical protein
VILFGGNNAVTSSPFAVVGDNTLAGNFIGVDVTGARALGNGGAGVEIAGHANGAANGNIIGGRLATDGNVVSGNAGSAIDVQDAISNVIWSDLIGTDSTGTRAIGNGGNGVYMHSQASWNRVVASTIAHNAGSGVVVGASSSDASVGDGIFQNGFFANGKLAIALGTQGGVSCSGPAPGPNDHTPCPIVKTVSASAVSGTACSRCRVEVYLASAQPSDLAHGEGKVFLGVTTAGGSRAWTLGGLSLHRGEKITATTTTTLLGSNTSEFSANVGL